MNRLVIPGSFVAAALVVASLFGPAARAGEGGVQYVEDIDTWRAELFMGAANAGASLQGPAKEVGGGVGLCFFPTGEGFAISGGAILSVSKDRSTVRYLAGTPGLPGYQDGPASQALLGLQLSACPDGKGGLFIGDRSNRCIRRLSQKDGKWTVDTVAGDPAKPEWQGKPTDGAGKEAVFRYLHSNIAADEAGNAWVIDNNFLRKIAPDGKVETLNSKGPGSGGPAAGGASEPLETAKFQLIMGGALCFGGDGCIYVADRWNHCIRKVDLKAKEVCVAVGPSGGYKDGPEKSAGFHDSPGSIVYDPWRNRFYTNGVDDNGLRVWEKGFMKTIAGGRNNKGFEAPAKEINVVWCSVIAVDPLPPHDIYFNSGGSPWAGRTGKLTQGSAGAKSEAKNPEDKKAPEKKPEARP